MTSALQVAIRKQIQKHGGNNEFLGEAAHWQGSFSDISQYQP
jgi:hypothetical protein